MDIGRKEIRLVKGTNTDKSEEGTTTGIVAPNGDMAFGATRNGLTDAAMGRSKNQLWISSQVRDLIRLNNCIKRKGRASFTLAPATMAAMNKKRFRVHTVLDITAVTTTLQRIHRVKGHGV